MWPFGNSAKKRLEDALAENPKTAPQNLNVDVKNSTAIITGEVPNEHYRKLVTLIAQGINGVKAVDVTGITVSGAEAEDENAYQPEDAIAKARQALSNDSSLANNPLDVTLRGDVLVLSGAVDSEEEIETAKQVARVEGVSEVDVSGLKVVANASTLNETDGEGNVAYTVQEGDTLSEIAARFYGDGSEASYKKLAQANGIDNPDHIEVGQQLKIPAPEKTFNL